MKKLSRRGFTIVELLIATLVFTVVITIIATAIVAISKVYYKGITLTDTQNAARTVLDTTSQALQFEGSVSPPTTSGDEGELCIGNHVFDYHKYQEATDTTHTFTSSTSSATDCAGPPNYHFNGQELLSPNMRLSEYDVQQLPGTNFWSIKVAVVYGDRDLLCDPSAASGTTAYCGDSGLITLPDMRIAGSRLRCKSTAGSQFCAVSKFSTIVERRVN